MLSYILYMIHWFPKFGTFKLENNTLDLRQADCLQLIFLSYFSADGMKPAMSFR